MKLAVAEHSYRLRNAFKIARGSRIEARVLIVTVEAGGYIGRGACVPYGHFGETVDGVKAAIRSLPLPIDRIALQRALPAGAARNGVDCALWDLEAKQAGCRVWEMAGLREPLPVETALTISLNSPQQMKRDAAATDASLIKIKLGSTADIDCLRAVRAGAERVRLIVDANEGWSEQDFLNMIPVLEECGVEMIEQPFPAGTDTALSRIETNATVCADESCRDRSSLASLSGRYGMVNIKLDKTGGLTEAFELRRQAFEDGFEVMIGCMLGPSLAMAPALLLAQNATYVDLDGPLLLAEDNDPPLKYHDYRIFPPQAELWG